MATVVNDVSLQVATVNGSGSQSANTVLLRAIFQMGVPVSGKNLFPSNIAGLPTWYTIRANKDGWVGRKKEIDILVAMNQESSKEDVASLRPGSAVIYDEPLGLASQRSDLAFYPVPFDKVVHSITSDAKTKKLLRNMAYVGVVAELLELEMPEVERAIGKHFAKKAKALELNLAAARAGFEFAKAQLEKKDPFVVRRMDANQGKIIIDGNSAAALGAMFGGVSVVTWYPITPSSSLVESLIAYMKKYRLGPDGKATFAIVQAEDELAAVGMVIGAGWAGARAMTATAGPGLSLMSEFVGLGYFAEVPAVIWDVQRVGPSTGLPTRTQQGDIAREIHVGVDVYQRQGQGDDPRWRERQASRCCYRSPGSPRGRPTSTCRTGTTTRLTTTRVANLSSAGSAFTPPAAPPRAGRRTGAAAYDAKAKEMFDLSRQSRKP